MRIFGALLLALACSYASAQERCATNEIMANKVRKESKDDFELWIRSERWVKESSRLTQESAIYEIPVVFHVLHDGSPIGSGTNISDDRIKEQVAILNEDFRRNNEDASDTPPEFASAAADTEIQFVLAKQDPEGLPSTGIVRLKGAKSIYSQSDDAAMMSESYWDQDLYLNIYVTDLTLRNLGYAQYPFSNLEGIASQLENYKSTDGIVLDYNFVGNNTNTGSFDSYGRTATHEIGHYLGLRHIWGDSNDCSLDDYCDDTPLSSSFTEYCPLDKTTCGSRDMIQNYMDYTDDVCMNLFTKCQKERMRIVLESSPRRKSLLTSPGLRAPILTTNDLGIRSIIAPLQSTCSTEVSPNIEVRNYGSNIINSFDIHLVVNSTSIQTKSVNIPLTTGSTSTVTFDQITLNDQVENVLSFTITAVNGTTGNNDLNDSKEITLSPFANEIIPYLEDFESNPNYSSRTENGEASSWTYKTAGTSSNLNNQAAVAPFYNQETNFGQQDLLLTRTLDLSGLSSAQLDFNYAYASRQQENTNSYHLDGLIIAISTNCGKDFERSDFIFEQYGRRLQTAGTSDSGFTPLDDSDWEDLSFNITEYVGADQVQIAFIGINGGGNNIYIDNISVSSANLSAYDAGIREITYLPTVICNTESAPVMEVKNYGFTTINELEFQVTINGQTNVYQNADLSISSGYSESFMFDLSDNINFGENEVTFEITKINGLEDENTSNNQETYLFLVEDSEEQIPLKEDFENEVTWITFSPDGESLFFTEEQDNNTVLYTDNFDNEISSKSYLVSPVIDPTNSTEASLRFRYSYAQRQNINDNLKVLLSLDCGRTFSQELLSLNSEQLAVTISSEAWIPQSHEDWKSVSIDLSEYVAWQGLRIALVFTNGGGNKLYIDDINILPFYDPLLPDFSVTENSVVVYPNPANQQFTAVFDLPEKKTVRVRLVDMTGRTVVDKSFKDLLNHKIDFQTPAQSGFYILHLSGKGLNESKRLFIQR